MYGVAAVLNIETSSYAVLLHWHQGNKPVYGKPERVKGWCWRYILWNGLLCITCILCILCILYIVKIIECYFTLIMITKVDNNDGGGGDDGDDNDY